MRPYEEMGKLLDQMRDNIPNEVWSLVYGEIRDFIISSSSYREEDILVAAAKAEESVRQLEEKLPELPEKTRLIEVIYIQLRERCRGILWFAEQIENKKREATKKEEEEKRGREEIKIREEKEILAWKKGMVKMAKIYSQESFKKLYKRFVQYQNDNGEWFPLDAIAYLKWMQEHKNNNEFPTDILEATKYIIPEECRWEFVKNFVSAVLIDTKKIEEYKGLADEIIKGWPKINWEII